jgi:hypothetical protein
MSNKKTLGQVAYEAEPHGGYQNFGPWANASELVKSVHETMAAAVRKEVLRRVGRTESSKQTSSTRH